MFRTLVKRELLNNILNLRFLIGLVLCLLATIACIMILARDYRQEMKDYDAAKNLQEEILAGDAAPKDLSLVEQALRARKPPERFRLLVVGIPGDEEAELFDYNPLPLLFPPLDLLFIVTIIMSLLALLFSYDAVAGERQSGTLKLVVANSISRAQVLLAKVVGGTVSLLIPFVLALLISVLYVAVHPAIQWDRSAWAELALLTGAAITFITSFYLLGLMVSTLSKYSTIAILNCLFLWVLLILVIPNICPYISAEFYRIPSLREAEGRTREIRAQQREIEIHSNQVARKMMNDAAERLRSQYGPLFSEFQSMSPKAAQQRAARDPQFKAMMEAFRKEQSKANDELERIRAAGAGKMEDVKREATLAVEDVRRKAALQTKLAKSLACISPYANFIYAARDVTGTGLRALDYFAQVKKEYDTQLGSYLIRKQKEAGEENPALKKRPSSDLRDRPRFVFKEEPLRDKLGEALPYWGILGLFNVVFFVAAFAGFMRYDVR
jgi:ABC-type transport system involved in multi-copper enzyme maturation permease subunit